MTIELIAGDAIQEIAKMPDASIDAVITDPPYCSGALTEAGRSRATHQGLRTETMAKGRFAWFDGDNMTTAGLAWLLRELSIEVYRVLKPTGHLVLFCDGRMVSTLHPAIESAGLRMRSLVVWDKGQFGLGNGFRHRHEIALHFCSDTPEYHATDVGDVITCARVTRDARAHPTEKPLGVIKEMIRVTTPEGGLVCDPFAGSGPVMIASRDLRRRAIGIERDPGYVALIRERLEVGPLFKIIAAE